MPFVVAIPGSFSLIMTMIPIVIAVVLVLVAIIIMIVFVVRQGRLSGIAKLARSRFTDWRSFVGPGVANGDHRATRYARS